MFWKPSSPRPSASGAHQPRRPRLPGFHAGQDTLPAWAPGRSQPATPKGSPENSPPRHPSRIPARMSRPEHPLHPAGVLSGPPGSARSRGSRANPNCGGQRLGSLGLAGAPHQPLSSGLQTAGLSLHARSYSGARFLPAAGGALRRCGTLSVCARRGLYLHPKQNNYTFVGGRKPVIRRRLFAAKQFLSGTPV